jgi:hypothetical protein
MAASSQQTVFALDCGATNWRLFRLEYRSTEDGITLVGDPQAAPLTSFIDRKLPAVLCLNPEGSGVESLGEVAQGQLENEQSRAQVREYFKPCIGIHLESNPLPHQKRYTHAQAMEYTGLMLRAVLEQIRAEKWRGEAFDDRLWFTFAYPIHWRYEHQGKILEEYQELVRNSFDGDFNQIRFVAEPEGAILFLQKRGLLTTGARDGISLIVDVGGSTTDIIAGKVHAKTGQLEFIGRYGEPFGGGLYDAELAKYISDELRIPASAIADDPSAMVSLRVAGQRLKESLSRQLSFSVKPKHPAQRTVTLVMQDGTVYRRTIHLETERFGEITQHLDSAFVNLIENALRTITLPPDDISQILLVGGGAQLFTIMNHLRERFGPDRIILADNPDEVVVGGIGLEYGASIAQKEPTIVFPVEPQEQARTESPTTQTPGWSLLDEDGNRSELGPGITRLGRGEANDFVIGDIKSSRFHAEISSIDGKLEIVDLGSTNGTFVNGQRLPTHDAQVLRVGDVISIGRIKYTVDQEAE